MLPNRIRREGSNVSQRIYNRSKLPSKILHLYHLLCGRFFFRTTGFPTNRLYTLDIGTGFSPWLRFSCPASNQLGMVY